MTIDTAETAAVAAQGAPVAPAPATPKKATSRQKATPKARKMARAASKKATPANVAAAAKKTMPAKHPRPGSKAAQVVSMLLRKNGASLQEIMDKTGWARHTIRGFMVKTRKLEGFTFESFKSASGAHSYRMSPS